MDGYLEHTVTSHTRQYEADSPLQGLDRFYHDISANAQRLTSDFVDLLELPCIFNVWGRRATWTEPCYS